ncbi:hemophore [Mycobacterium xenopi]|uniref:Heme-binding protein n=1 Tax=Mycobacterium xenopi TaxID=1789 RepID=A0AAD1M360_MYCXE|nr:hemophore [Mycobacterium xenopi]EID12687.1 exported protein [Mycobacterium xenopi RIVM700367]MDA3640479.1 hemophore [Mycobacterium xenopi]MDA3656638.1 hemophore [Mycobacterium xenopi]MDA3661233.1 hemophore [Mycobacterium xenopi]ORX20238.1 Fis family transcriptional regulator [Mycobacterium xenopi]
MKKTAATLRHGLFGVLSAAAIGGAAAAVMAVPSASGAQDPCAASEMAKTVGSVAKSAGDYLDSHPETNQAMTTILQQPAGPQSVTSLKSYFEANPKVASDLQTISQPLTGLGTKCKLPITIPQMLGLMQGAQNGLPGAGVQPVAGTPGGAPAAPPLGAGSLPGPAAASPITAVR